jgi:hypothetical protein
MRCKLFTLVVAAAVLSGCAQGQSQTSKVFSRHPENPACFVYQGKPFKILTSAEHYGAVINADFDYEVYLQEMERTGQNATRVFTFYRETPTTIEDVGTSNTLAPTPKASVMPWQRVSGHGKAGDGLDKFDLDKWNPQYFSRMKDYVRACAKRGVVCEIVLFCCPYSQELYDRFPCSKVSNINGVGADIKHIFQFMTLEVPSIVDFQEKFVRKIVTELNSFDNVYYEICNEPEMFYKGWRTEANEAKIKAWQEHLIGLIRKTEAALSKRHLVAVNCHLTIQADEQTGKGMMRQDDLFALTSPDVDIVNYHYISAKSHSKGLYFAFGGSSKPLAGATWSFLRQRDNYNKPIVFDESYSGVLGEKERYAMNRAEAWEMLLSGGAGYSNLDWTFTPADETGSGKAPIADGRRLDGHDLRRWLQILRDLLGKYDIAALRPAQDLLPKEIPGYGYGALKDNQGRYLIYLVDECLYRAEPCPAESVSISLNLPAGRFTVETLEPRTGQRTRLPDSVAESQRTLVLPSFTEDIALMLRGPI